MTRSHATAAVYLVSMVGTIAAVDVLFFRGRFWERLLANVVIVLVFAGLYFIFMKRR